MNARGVTCLMLCTEAWTHIGGRAVTSATLLLYRALAIFWHTVDMLELSIILLSEVWEEEDETGMNARRDASRLLVLCCLHQRPTRRPEDWPPFSSARPFGTCASLALDWNCAEIRFWCVIGLLGSGRWEEVLLVRDFDIRIESIVS